MARVEKDLCQGISGNATNKMPMKVKNKVGRTDPEIKNPGHLIPTKKVRQKGWCE